MNKVIHQRMKFILLCFIIVFICIVGRIFFVQVIDYNKLSKLSNDLWSHNLPITADRGLILDRNGNILAGNITTVSLYLVPAQIKNKEEVSIKLADILNISVDEMKKHVYKKTSIERVHPEGRNLNSEIANQINNLNYDGIYLLKEAKRYYPNEELLSHVLGFVGIDNQGLSGLELMYNDYLTGSDGSIKYYSDGLGNRLKMNEVYHEPTNGMNITLTIDLDIQKSIERELDNIISKYQPEQALILAENPKTGEILGMSSRPTFNPNNYQSSSVEVINRNLPIWMTYEPGSTFKIITLASAIEEKKVNIFTDTYYDSGHIMVENARIKCWKAGGHGGETFLQVVENSCNPGFVVLGQRLGKEKLFDYIDKFGFGMKSGIDLTGESNGILFNIDKVGPVELATSSFGQGVSVTPIQQVNAVSAVVNGGTLLKPYVVKEITDSMSNSVIFENERNEIRQVISKETSDLVKYALESVVANGTGRNAYIENYRVGGKTGTAQKVENGHYLVGNYIVSFMGFMPSDDPEIVLYVAIDNPKGITQYGGTVSAPIAKSILEEAADILNIKPSTEGMPKVYNWYDTKYIKVPDVTNMLLEDANKLLKGFDVRYVGSGKRVIKQEPLPNTYIKELGTIRLMLGD